MTAHKVFLYNEYHIDNEYVCFKQTPTKDIREVEQQLLSSPRSFDVEYTANIIVWVNTKASKPLTREVLAFLHASALNSKSYNLKHSFFPLFKKVSDKRFGDRHCGHYLIKILRWNIPGMNQKEAWVYHDELCESNVNLTVYCESIERGLEVKTF